MVNPVIEAPKPVFAAAAKDEFHLYNWNNYIAPETVKRFEELCKCEVVQTYYSDNEELLAKLAAGARGYDMYVPTSNAVQALIKSGKLKPIDKSALPNLKNIDPRYLNTSFDPGNTGTQVINSLAWGNTRGFAFGNFYPLRNGGLQATGALIQCAWGNGLIDFGLISKIHSAVKPPLVLHGTCGVSLEDISRSVKAGMTKINELFFYGAVNRTLSEVFPVVAPYQGFISCFGTPWGFILASKGTDPRKQSAADIDRLIAERLDPKQLGYWDGNAHLHCFSLPKFLRESIEKNDRVITDKNPLIVT